MGATATERQEQGQEGEQLVVETTATAMGATRRAATAEAAAEAVAVISERNDKIRAIMATAGDGWWVTVGGGQQRQQQSWSWWQQSSRHSDMIESDRQRH